MPSWVFSAGTQCHLIIPPLGLSLVNPRWQHAYSGQGVERGEGQSKGHMPTLPPLKEGPQKQPWASHSAGPSVACPVGKGGLEQLSWAPRYAQQKRPFTVGKKGTCAWPGPAASGTAANPVALVIAVRK